MDTELIWYITIEEKGLKNDKNAFFKYIFFLFVSLINNP